MPSVFSNFRLGETDEDGNYIGARPADLIAKVSVIFATLFTILYITEAVLLFVVPTLNDINEISWEIAPRFSIGLIGATILIGIIANPIGVYGVCTLKRSVSRNHFFLSLLLFAVNLVVFVYILMSGNGIIATGRKTNGNDIDGKVGINSFADDTQANIVRFALAHPDTWRDIQESLNGGCCGLNVQALYADQVFGIKDFSLSDLNSGVQCQAGGAGNLTNDLLRDFPNFSDTVPFIVANDPNFAIFNSINFFCERFLAAEVKGQAQSFAVLWGLQTFFELILCILVGLLIYGYEEEHGGMKQNDDPLHMRPKVESTPYMRAEQNNDHASSGVSRVSSVGKIRATNSRKPTHFS